MDTSETYIKMCEKAEEIQDLRKDDCWESGDFLYGEDELYGKEVRPVIESWWYHSKYPLYELMGGDSRRFDCSDYVWLPRQDQLQEMVGGFDAGFVNWDGWIRNIYPEQRNPFSKSWRFASMEQLWLAFVMKEKYGKIWSNGEWIKDRR